MNYNPFASLLYIAALIQLCACSSTQTTLTEPTAVISVPATDAHIITMGRTLTTSDSTLLIGFPGVTIKANVIGRKLTAAMHSSSGNSWVDIIVDESEVKTVNITNQLSTVALFDFPESGKHSVEIIHRSENWHGQLTIEHFDLSGEKFLLPTPLPKRKILLLGDSVTCGEAIDRIAGENKNPRWWNARESYGMLTAKALNAQIQLVCWGGRGLVRSWNGKTDEANLPDFYAYTVGDHNSNMIWDHTKYQPDLIVSAIGTNDFSQGIPEREAYVTAYVKFINTLLSNHPQAHIALTEGAILNGEKKAALIDYIREAISRVNNVRVQQVTSLHYPGDALDAHPTKEQHAAMANDLTPQLKALMDW
jgi:lysophospholipase L1-like esterase